MSDILDIQSHFGSEFDEIESNAQRLKTSAKRRKGRGFETHCDSELEKIQVFDSLRTSKICDTNGPQKSVEGWVLFVRGLHEEANEDDVRELFSEYGTVSNISANMDRRTGFLKGYALIEFKSFQDANNARENLNETSMLNRTILVDWSFVQGSNIMRKKHFKKW